MRSADSFSDSVVRTVAGERLHLGKSLGDGHEGYVYPVNGSDGAGPDAAVKIFKPETQTVPYQERKLRTMVREPPPDPNPDASHAGAFVWPTAVIETETGDEFLGYKMPYLDLSTWHTAESYAMDKLDWTKSTWTDRYTAAINLAEIVAVLHRHRHAIGDMNQQNIYVADEAVTILDCDSYHISGPTRTFPGETIFHRYAPPDGRGETLQSVRYADRFGLSVHVFQFLMGGYHPYQAFGDEAAGPSHKEWILENPFPYTERTSLDPRPDAPPYTELPRQVQALFENCFISGRRNPRMRPSAETWVDTLEEARADANGGSQLSRRNGGRQGGQGTQNDGRANAGGRRKFQKEIDPDAFDATHAAEEPVESETDEDAGGVLSFIKTCF